MRAIGVEQYGPIDHLESREVPAPHVFGRNLLIRYMSAVLQ